MKALLNWSGGGCSDNRRRWFHIMAATSCQVGQASTALHIVRGNRNRDIGDLLHISEETVKTHMSRIMQKLGARDRAQAIAIAVRRGFLKL